MDIFIVSSGRHLRQTTWWSLPRELREKVKLVVPELEVDIYLGAGYPEGTVLGCPTIGIGKTRQWCLDQSKRSCVMLDDDLKFAVRDRTNLSKFLPANDEDIMDLFSEIETGLEDYAHVGVATREGGNRRTDLHYNIGRVLRILCYRADWLREQNVRFDRLPVMEDFDVTLNLLRKGFANYIINWIVHNQNGSNLKGGCSQYRTKEMQHAAAHLLKEHHPQFVDVVTKETKTAWGGGTRTDVRIQWKKAYEADI